jgi:hypothetical protein
VVELLVLADVIGFVAPSGATRLADVGVPRSLPQVGSST